MPEANDSTEDIKYYSDCVLLIECRIVLKFVLCN